MIVLHIMAMLDWISIAPWPQVPGGELTAAIVGLIVASTFYLYMDIRLGIVMTALFAACIPLGRLMPEWSVIALALVGWSIQLAGHWVWEKNRPAFAANLAHALVGPVFFVAVLSGRWRPGTAR